MKNLALRFVQVDLDAHLATCLRFRKDAYVVSFGHDKGYCEAETTKWFEHLSKHNPNGFLHVMMDNEIIGQLEFKAGLEQEGGGTSGYVNLFYLTPEWRGTGVGQQLHDFVIDELTKQGCTQAHLRYIPGNMIAERFYAKNDWTKSGEPSERGQLLVRQLT